MRREGDAVFVDGLSIHERDAESAAIAHGTLILDAPIDAALIIHSSHSAVQARDVAGRLYVTTTHARTKLLNTTGRVDAVGFVIDFASSSGDVQLNAEAEINIVLMASRFRGRVWASAQRDVRVVVPSGFDTSIHAVVRDSTDFVCRADFASRIRGEHSGGLYHANYDASEKLTDVIYLRSEHGTVVLDTVSMDAIKEAGNANP
jgi:hypothetical protein